MLLRALRLRRRSDAPGAGHGVEDALGVGHRVDGAHRGGHHAVGAEAVEQRLDHVRERGRGARGRRDQVVAARVEGHVVDAVDQGDGVLGQRPALGPHLEGGAVDHLLGATGEVAAQRAAGGVDRPRRVVEGARWCRPPAAPGCPSSRCRAGCAPPGAPSPACRRRRARRARGRRCSRTAAPRRRRGSGGCCRRSSRSRSPRRPPPATSPDLAAEVDHQAREVPARDVVPERELADAAEAVDPQRLGVEMVAHRVVGLPVVVVTAGPVPRTRTSATGCAPR